MAGGKIKGISKKEGRELTDRAELNIKLSKMRRKHALP